METVGKTELVIIIVAAILMTLLGTIYVVGKKTNKKKVLGFKAAATLVADGLALLGALQQQTFASWCIVIGIFLYACADILLELKFIYGVACFGLAHLWVIAGISRKGVTPVVVLLVFLLLFAIALSLFKPYLARLKQLKVPGLIYTAILCTMSATMFGVLWAGRTWWDLIRAFGSICFVTSDAIIGWNFVNRSKSRTSDIILMILYYLAVYLIGLSVVF